MKDAPWVRRQEGEVSWKFPWAPGMLEEDKRDFENTVKSIIPRMGAKSKLLSYIIPRFPDCHTYVEPFGGSFKVLMNKEKVNKIEIINDIDDDLVHFFRYVVFWPNELVEMVNSIPCHQGIMNALRDELVRGKLTGLERAAATYYSIKLSFNGTGKSFAGSVHSLARARADISIFKGVAERLKKADIRCKDAHELIALCNRKLDQNRYPGGIFFYLDPPYDETGGYATLKSRSIYGKAEQYHLFTLAKKIHENGNRFMMTNSYTKYLREMWCTVPDWFHVKRKVKYTISGDSAFREDTDELIVANFPFDEVHKKKNRSGRLFGKEKK